MMPLPELHFLSPSQGREEVNDQNRNDCSDKGGDQRDMCRWYSEVLIPREGGTGTAEPYPDQINEERPDEAARGGLTHQLLADYRRDNGNAEYQQEIKKVVSDGVPGN